MEETESSKKIVIEENKTTSNDPSQIRVQNKKLGVWGSIFSLWMSRKLWMTLIASLIIYGTYWHTINHLYSFERPDQVSALSTMYIAMLSVLGVIVSAYLGTNAIQSKFGISSAAQIIGNSLVEKKDQNTNTNTNETVHKIEEITKNINLEEFIRHEGFNAPETRPFSQKATASVEDEADGDLEEEIV